MSFSFPSWLVDYWLPFGCSVVNVDRQLLAVPPLGRRLPAAGLRSPVGRRPASRQSPAGRPAYWFMSVPGTVPIFMGWPARAAASALKASTSSAYLSL